MTSWRLDGILGMLAGRCPHCNGNCVREKDGNHPIKFCLMCGRRWNLDNSPIIPKIKRKWGRPERW